MALAAAEPMDAISSAPCSIQHIILPGQERGSGSGTTAMPPAWSAQPKSSSGAMAVSETPLDPASSNIMATPFRVADLFDHYSGPYGSPEQLASTLRVLEPGLSNFGGRRTFFGRVSTIKCSDSNVLVHSAVQEPGHGRVLVVDNGGSMRSACLGDILAERAYKAGWSGIIVSGCIRDAATLASIPIGCKALAANPIKPGKGAPGQRDLPVVVGGLTINPGDWLYADEDGVVVSPTELDLDFALANDY